MAGTRNDLSSQLGIFSFEKSKNQAKLKTSHEDITNEEENMIT